MSDDEKTGTKESNLVKHNIRNQLSNITLCLEQLTYEVTEQSSDFQYYHQTITASCKSINALLDNI